MDIEDRLRGEHLRLAGSIGELERSHAGIIEASVGSTDDEHDPEGQTVAVEREQVAALLREARAQLLEVEAAFSRVGAFTYGTCTDCGRPIAAARLDARPATPVCIDCA